MDIPPVISEIIRRALEEDLGFGDVTTMLLVPGESHSKALYIAKGNFVLAGFPFAKEVFTLLDPDVSLKVFFDEGAKIKKGDVLGEISGKTRVLFSGERVSLNILQRLSGIATLTA